VEDVEPYLPPRASTAGKPVCHERVGKMRVTFGQQEKELQQQQLAKMRFLTKLQAG